jgi:hypothetical protein
MVSVIRTQRGGVERLVRGEVLELKFRPARRNANQHDQRRDESARESVHIRLVPRECGIGSDANLES